MILTLHQCSTWHKFKTSSSPSMLLSYAPFLIAFRCGPQVSISGFQHTLDVWRFMLSWGVDCAWRCFFRRLDARSVMFHWMYSIWSRPIMSEGHLLSTWVSRIPALLPPYFVDPLHTHTSSECVTWSSHSTFALSTKMFQSLSQGLPIPQSSCWMLGMVTTALI